MLAKTNRITTREMKTLSRPQARSYQSVFTLLYFSASEQKKVAVVVSKKVSKKAVVRNRLRRQLYALVSAELSALPNGYYVLRVQPAALSSDFSTLKKELCVAFGEISKAR